jgi:hypothetical protein
MLDRVIGREILVVARDTKIMLNQFFWEKINKT